tara:strand:- start:12321 stop:14669 length:2349 start_codon:yes stop_codon:yes gene_type:complete
MTNKFFVGLIIFFSFFFSQSLLGKDLDINAKTIEVEKSNQIISADGNVEVTDDENNIISAEKIKYDKAKQLLNTFGKTEMLTSEKFKIKGENIIYDNIKKIVSSNDKTEIVDIDGNKIFVNMFNYIVDKNMFLSSGEIKIIDRKNNTYYFSEIYIDEKKRKIVGSDIRAFLNDGSFKHDPRNEPRFFANSATISEDYTTFNKAVFTTCKDREEDKCPPWMIRAKEIKHNSAEKTIYYDNALLKIYDFPIFYFPKFFHPDPTVKRQSGFLMPQFANNSTVGFSTSIPYFWAISEDKDMTITPKIYTAENILIKNEYRQAFKNSFLILDSSYTKGYKETNDKKTSGSRNHIFANFKHNFSEKENSYSNLEINLEHVSNDTYLKVHDVNSQLAESNKHILKNELKYQYQNNEEYFGLMASAYEDMDKTDRSKYEYIIPNLVYERNLISDEKIGIIDLYTSAIAKNYKVNQTTKFLVNDIGWKSRSFSSIGGIQTNLEGLLKVVTYEAENTENYKNEEFNAETYGALAYNTSLPMFKKDLNKNRINFLTPKISLRHAPGHMRNIHDSGLKLSYSNLFALNKNSQLDVVESGTSAAVGLEFSNLDFHNNKAGNENYSLYIGQIYNFEENFDMPSRSSLDQKVSDLVGKASIKFSENFSLNNEFSVDQNLNEINYNDLKASFLLGNAKFNLGYLEENNHIGSNSYFKSDVKLEINKSNNLSFDLKKNLETDSTEFYNLAYNYINDCLKAGLVYRREFYTDRDVESSDTLMFNVSLFPFGNVSLPTVDR